MAMISEDPDLDLTEIHDVLSNERRQLVLKLLGDTGGGLEASELAAEIAEVESGQSPPPENVRQSAYVALHQTHLPKLDELGIVNYDQNNRMVELREGADQINVYLETVPKYGLSWSEVYIGISLLGMLLIIAGEIGVPLLVEIGSLVLASATFSLLILVALYQTISQRSSFIHRIRG